MLNRELSTTSSENDSSDSGAYTINLRHYAISTKRTGLSRGIRKLNAAEKASRDRKRKQAIPNLGRLDDVADYVLDPAAAGGFTSGSESEIETDAEVEVLEAPTRKVLNRQQLSDLRSKNEKVQKLDQVGTEKKAVKLVEIGPRMKLRMTKVEEGVCDGKIMWHEYISKSKEEVDRMERIWEVRRREKEERRRVQKENIERKRTENGEGKENGQHEEKNGRLDDEEWDDDDFNDDNEMELHDEDDGVAVD